MSLFNCKIVKANRKRVQSNEASSFALAVDGGMAVQSMTEKPKPHQVILLHTQKR